MSTPPASQSESANLAAGQARQPLGNTAWTSGERFLFRFVCLYLGLYGGQYFVLHLIPSSWYPAADWWYGATVRVPSRQIAMTVFRMCVDYPMGWTWGCDLLESIWLAMLCFLAACVWTYFDRKHLEYRTLHSWLRVLLRYLLFYVMFGYGPMKIYGVQFPFGPEGETLLAPLGDMSKTRMLWDAMGISYLYACFTGFGEVLSGALLLWRRTATLGALIGLMVMANVAALDITHHVTDVGVKSLNFALAALVLLARDGQRLLRFYIFDESVEAQSVEKPFVQSPWRPWVKTGVAIAILAYLTKFHDPREGYWRIRPARHPLAGIFQVERFTRNGTAVPPTLGDSTRWERVALGPSGGSPGYINFLQLKQQFLGVQALRMDGVWSGFDATVDSTIARIAVLKPTPLRYSTKGELIKNTGTAVVLGGFSYRWSRPGTLQLAGRLGSDSVDLSLRRLDEDSAVLFGGRGHFPRK